MRGALGSSFNEAAGIHRRKPVARVVTRYLDRIASMRPPEFTGGNPAAPHDRLSRSSGFNEAAGIHRRKPAAAAGGPKARTALQ